MRHCFIVAGLCISSFFLLSWRSSPCPQEAPGKAKSTPNSIEGEWFQISSEMEGGVGSSLPDTRPPMPGELTITDYYIWRITGKTIEMGPDKEGWFPQWRDTYELNPDNQEGTIDITSLDEGRENEKEDKPKRTRGIYFVKGDYLLICIGRDARPKDFTSSKDNPNRVFVLRRGKLRFGGSNITKPKPDGK